MKFKAEEKPVEILVARALHAIGVTSVAFEMSGSGDEGGIDNVTYAFSGEEMSNNDVEAHLRAMNPSGGTIRRNLYDELESLADKVVSDIGNYADNEGGSGGVTFLVSENGLEEEEAWMEPGEEDLDDDDELDEDDPDYEPEM